MIQKNPFVYQWITEEGLGFGRHDLILNLDGSWSTEVEGTYCTGDKMSRDQRRAYLCGRSDFIPDKLEIWVIDYSL